MRLIIQVLETLEESEIVIRHGKDIDPQTQLALDYLQSFSAHVMGTSKGATYKLPLVQLHYIDCVDNRTYLYMSDKVYESGLKLYQLEAQLVDTPFVRIGKSTILNIDFLESVRPLLNGKLEVLLTNNEKLIVNRRYVNDFREKFGI